MAAFPQHGPSAEPPAPFRQTSPVTLELREGGGGMAVFGLPFFLAGLLIALAILRLVHIKIDPEPQGIWVFLAFAAMSATFIGVGAVMMFGRRWLTLDVSRGTLVRSYGLLVPLRTQERLLSEFNAVVLAYDTGDSDSPERYPVRLRGIAGQDFVVRTPAKFGESRALAEYLAAFLRLPLVDAITDHETVVAPERAGQSLGERLRGGSMELPQPERPPNMRCAITESGGTTTVVIPAGGGWSAHVLSIVLPLLVLLFVLPRLHRALTPAGAPAIVHFSFFVLLVPMIVLPLIFVSVNLMVRSARKRTTVTASAQGLEIEQRIGWRTRRRLLAAADLLDVDCFTADGALQAAAARASSIRVATASPNPAALQLVQQLKKWLPSKGIIVKSRQELICFGEGLPAAELQYLSWVLRRALSAR